LHLTFPRSTSARDWPIERIGMVSKWFARTDDAFKNIAGSAVVW